MGDLVSITKYFVDVYKPIINRVLNTNLGDIDVVSITYLWLEDIKKQIESRGYEAMKDLAREMQLPVDRAIHFLEQYSLLDWVDEFRKSNDKTLMTCQKYKNSHRIIVFDVKPYGSFFDPSYLNIQFATIHELVHASISPEKKAEQRTDPEYRIRETFAAEGLADVIAIDVILPQVKSKELTRMGEFYSNFFLEAYDIVNKKLHKGFLLRLNKDIISSKYAISYPFFKKIYDDFGIQGLKSTIHHIPTLTDYLPGEERYFINLFKGKIISENNR